MEEFNINNEELSSLAGSVVVVTGGSSGIGLATVQLLLELNASVVAGDLNPPPTEHPKLSFVKTNVAIWTDLTTLFKHAKQLHGRIDHVFANAGISGRANYMTEELDADGEIVEPTSLVYDINLKGMINTSYLGMYYMRNQEPAGGSIVATGSASSFQRFRVADYTTAKHGVLGFMRGVVPNLNGQHPHTRLNAIAPSWTATGLVPSDRLQAIGITPQEPVVVAKSVAILMADKARQGQLIYSAEGHYWEIEESIFVKQGRVIAGTTDEDTVVAGIVRHVPGMESLEK